ncbi:unnamed protein product [Brassicogethes aeneus]|uniref:Protein PTHB1 n=1 Tax=Brassicogethes aeneus TaxID=1431903 RepID=A0A9P0FGY5_BRAAE|nr:unnamed protein product [Brassicogethes aeneus]
MSSYKKLSEVSERDNDDNSSDSATKVSPNWIYNLGECAMDIKVIEDNAKKESSIMILGERNLFCLSDRGRLKFMKKLDYSPICFYPYTLDDRILTLIVSETSTLIIYQNSSVKWSAQLQFLPICITRAFLRGIWGATVLLSEEGRLECCYLGTDPSLFVAPVLNVKEINFDEAETQLAELNRIIKSAHGNDIKVTNASAEKELTIIINASPHLEEGAFKTNINTTEKQKMCVIKIDVVPQAVFEELQLSYCVKTPLKVTPQVHFFTNLSERTSVNCHCFLDESYEVCSLNLTVVASYISSLGVPRTLTKNVMLPITLAVDSCAAQKDSAHKVTVNVNESPVPLTVLFPEFSVENSNNAIGFKNISGSGKVVSILLAKSSGRYRLQSDSFASLNLLIEIILVRLAKHFSNKCEFKVSYASALPANELLSYVNSHFNVRQRVKNLQAELMQLSCQYRVIQKRLIAKFKVKNPTSLVNLELLLEDTHKDIVKVTDALGVEMEELKQSKIELSCALKVIKNLIGIMDVKKDIKDYIEATFCENIVDVDTQNWEDVIDGSFCYLLRTVLAKNEKDKLRATQSSFEEVKDVSKVEKHLVQVLERITNKFSERNDSKDSIEEEANEDSLEEEKPLVPVGSKFGESSSRLLSARKRHNLQETIMKSEQL